VRQLIWKEWHEQGWKLAFGCIVLSAFAGIGLRTRIIPDGEMVMLVCFPAMVLLPLLAATGLVPAERADDTLESLAALPVTMREIFAVKTITGVMLCVGPLLTAMGVSLFVAGGREMAVSSMVEIYVLSASTALALFFWIFTLTVRLPSEARAAMVGIGVLICWLMLAAWLGPQRVADQPWDEPERLPIMSCISPFTFVLEGAGRLNGPPLLLTAFVQLVIAATLWFWASRAISKDVNSTE
jgi:hypothetical protein